MSALMPAADAVGKWLTTTTVGQQMVQQPWLWPACETLHFVGLALLIGRRAIRSAASRFF